MIATLVVIITILFITYVILIKPNKRRIDKMPTDMYAHRGLHNGNDIIENSLSAFKRAADKSFGVELDVQLTKDKKLVVFHDDNLKRVCGANTVIAQNTFEELQKYRLKGTNDTIPLFSEVLRVMGGLPIICEIKHPTGAADTEICSYVAEAVKTYKGNICIESFSPFSVAWFKKHCPDVIRGILSADFGDNKKMPFIERFATKNLLFNIFASPDFIAYRFTDDSAGFKLCRDLYNPISIAWTTRGKEQTDNAKNQNRFDVYIFEEKAENSDDND